MDSIENGVSQNPVEVFAFPPFAKRAKDGAPTSMANQGWATRHVALIPATISENEEGRCPRTSLIGLVVQQLRQLPRQPRENDPYRQIPFYT